MLVEVNAHSLFSKWFSESGKLVSRLFAKIQAGAGRAGGRVGGWQKTHEWQACNLMAGMPGECGAAQPASPPSLPPALRRLSPALQEVVDEADTLVFVLIDEVESLTAAR